jgi:hypothetical protein
MLNHKEQIATKAGDSPKLLVQIVSFGVKNITDAPAQRPALPAREGMFDINLLPT